jgi:hypothetical protein
MTICHKVGRTSSSTRLEFVYVGVLSGAGLVVRLDSRSGQ